MSFNLIYSLNVKVIFSLSKKVVLFFGDALIKIGGIVSLNPPVGVPLLAQARIKSKQKLSKILFSKVV